MSQTAVSITTVVLSVALAIAATSYTRTSAAAATATPASDPVESVSSEVIEDLVERCAALERRCDEVLQDSRAAHVSSVAAVEASTSFERSEADWLANFALLERRVRQLEGEHAPALSPAEQELKSEVDELAQQQRTALAKQALLDPDATDEQKLGAHEALRHVPDAYTPEMVGYLLAIGMAHSDAEVRADVWRFFDGANRLPAIVSSLLHAMTDDDERVRAEAAETLGNYIKAEGVMQTLEHAAEHDTSEGVRKRAWRTLQLSS